MAKGGDNTGLIVGALILGVGYVLTRKTTATGWTEKPWTGTPGQGNSLPGIPVGPLQEGHHWVWNNVANTYENIGPIPNDFRTPLPALPPGYSWGLNTFKNWWEVLEPTQG